MNALLVKESSRWGLIAMVLVVLALAAPLLMATPLFTSPEPDRTMLSMTTGMVIGFALAVLLVGGAWAATSLHDHSRGISAEPASSAERQ